jgi:hypothetical protein
LACVPLELLACARGLAKLALDEIKKDAQPGRNQSPTREYDTKIGIPLCAPGSNLHDSRRLAQTLAGIETLAELIFAVERLERRQREARERVENLLAQAQPTVAETVDSGPANVLAKPTMI